MDAALFELLFTVASCGALLVLLLASAAILPWTEQELDEVEHGLRALAATVLAEPSLAEPILSSASHSVRRVR
ncbi:MAG: hypothetical protein VX519_12705 [Myxococcota bacterium]|nr:hypothetical protein [Myxococcota bacterium]